MKLTRSKNHLAHGLLRIEAVWTKGWIIYPRFCRWSSGIVFCFSPLICFHTSCDRQKNWRDSSNVVFWMSMYGVAKHSDWEGSKIIWNCLITRISMINNSRSHEIVVRIHLFPTFRYVSESFPDQWSFAFYVLSTYAFRPEILFGVLEYVCNSIIW